MKAHIKYPQDIDFNFFYPSEEYLALKKDNVVQWRNYILLYRFYNKKKNFG